MKYLGYLLIAWGAADLGMSFMDMDLWGMIGVTLPEMVWKYSAYIAMAAGFGVLQLGKKSDEGEAATEQEG